MTIDSCRIGNCNLDFLIVYRRDEIIKILKVNFAERNGINLPIFGVEKTNLVDFTTTEKDKKRGSTRFPPVQFRMIEENELREASET